MTPLKSETMETASSVHNAIMAVSEAYGRQLAKLAAENAALRQELEVARGRLAADRAAKENKKEPPMPGPPPGAEGA